MRWLDFRDPDDRAYAADMARDDAAAEAERPMVRSFDPCHECGRYLPGPKRGGIRFCAECAPFYVEWIAHLERLGRVPLGAMVRARAGLAV